MAFIQMFILIVAVAPFFILYMISIKLYSKYSPYLNIHSLSEINAEVFISYMIKQYFSSALGLQIIFILSIVYLFIGYFNYIV